MLIFYKCGPTINDVFKVRRFGRWYYYLIQSGIRILQQSAYLQQNVLGSAPTVTTPLRIMTRNASVWQQATNVMHVHRSPLSKADECAT